MTDTLPSLNQVSELIGKIYEAALDKRLWTSFLESLAHSFGTHQALLLNVDSIPIPGGLISTVGMDLDVVRKWEGSKEHVDVWYQGVQRQCRDMPYVGPDLCTDVVLHKSAFYADSLQRLDIEYTLGGIAVESELRRWVITVFRSAGAGPFSDQHKALYALLIPHFSRAIKLNQTLARSESNSATLREALDHSPYGIVALDDSRAVVSANHKAAATLAASDGITVRGRAVRFVDSEGQRRFEWLAANPIANMQPADASDSGGVFTAKRPSGKHSYQVFACPLNTYSDVPYFGPRASWLLFICDPDAARSISAELLRSLYDLTASEARLCAELYRTGSLGQATSTARISRNTAKTHLSRIFEKTGTASQAELLRELALGIAAAASPDGPANLQSVARAMARRGASSVVRLAKGEIFGN